jgi:Protein of unknown function (DUF3102)
VKNLQQTNKDIETMTSTTEAIPTSSATIDDDEAFLAKVVSEIHALPEGDKDNLILAGLLLAEAKKRLPYDQWLPWLECEFGWTEYEASKLLDVREDFVDLHHRAELYNNASLKVFFEAVDESRRRARTGEAEPPRADGDYIPHPYSIFEEKQWKARDALRDGVGLSLGWRPPARTALDFDTLMALANSPTA